jgi:hypothetical protein
MNSKPKEKSKKKIEAGLEGAGGSWYYLGDTELGQVLLSRISGSTPL